jgi:hypothetical protein
MIYIFASMIEELLQKDRLTLAEIHQLTGYSTTVTTYQMLRLRGIHPVAKKKNPSGGGDIGEYATADVLGTFGERIEIHQFKLRRKSEK